MSIDTIVYDKKNTVAGIALLQNGELRELEIVNESQAISGNIYLGKVTKKLNLAHDKEGFFVNIGMDKDAFLNADETGMSELKLTEGQSIVVQVAQESRAEKNARLVRAVQLVGKYLVYCPYRMSVDASSKIENKAILSEYLENIRENMTGQEGWILRTASVEVPFEDVLEEMQTLRETYEQVRHKARTAHAPSLLYAKPDPLFDYFNRYPSIKTMITNSRNIGDEVTALFADEISIEINKEPFEEYGIDEAVADALEKIVNLKNGGRVIIEETRACVAVDVDTGKDIGGGSINRINEEAAKEIAKQIRLRNLSGRIIIDFAGHSEYKYIKPLLDILEEELSDDSIKNHICGLSRAGFVEIVRVRKRPSLSELMTEECPTCQGLGKVEKGS